MRLILVIGLLAASGSPGLPASTMTDDGNHVKYCVSGYAPDRPVTIVEERIDLTVRVRTHIDGSACTHLPARSVCGQVIERSAVATGIGADGNPATSRATLKERPDPATCPPIPPREHHPSTAGGRISLSGAGVALLAVVGVAIFGLLAVGVVALRRRARA